MSQFPLGLGLSFPGAVIVESIRALRDYSGEEADREPQWLSKEVEAGMAAEAGGRTDIAESIYQSVARVLEIRGVSALAARLLERCASLHLMQYDLHRARVALEAAAASWAKHGTAQAVDSLPPLYEAALGGVCLYQRDWSAAFAAFDAGYRRFRGQEDPGLSELRQACGVGVSICRMWSGDIDAASRALRGIQWRRIFASDFDVWAWAGVLHATALHKAGKGSEAKEFWALLEGSAASNCGLLSLLASGAGAAGQFVRARHYYEYARDVATRDIGDGEILGELAVDLARAAFARRRHKLGKEWLARARRSVRGRQEAEPAVLRQIVGLHDYATARPAAIKAGTRGLAIARARKDWLGAARFLASLGLLRHREGDLVRAHHAYATCAKLANRCHADRLRGDAFEGLATIARDRRQPQKERRFLELALACCEPGDPRSKELRDRIGRL